RGGPPTSRNCCARFERAAPTPSPGPSWGGAGLTLLSFPNSVRERLSAKLRFAPPAPRRAPGRETEFPAAACPNSVWARDETDTSGDREERLVGGVSLLVFAPGLVLALTLRPAPGPPPPAAQPRSPPGPLPLRAARRGPRPAAPPPRPAPRRPPAGHAGACGGGGGPGPQGAPPPPPRQGSRLARRAAGRPAARRRPPLPRRPPPRPAPGRPGRP